MRGLCSDGASSRVQPRRFNEVCATTGRRRLRRALAAAVVAGFSAHPAAAENIVYPSKVRAVVDVTKTPYFADPTGRRDCTAALVRAMDDVLREDRAVLHETLANLNGEKKDVWVADRLTFAERQRILAANPRAVIGFERTQGIWPHKNQPARILYFPNGTYLLSDTLVYSFEDLRNGMGKELNRCLHFQGQSESGTILRLEDHAPGFGAGTRKPVVTSRGATPRMSPCKTPSRTSRFSSAPATPGRSDSSSSRTTPAPSGM